MSNNAFGFVPLGYVNGGLVSNASLLPETQDEYYIGWDECKARILRIINQESGEGSLDLINVENLIQRINNLP